MNFHTVCFVSYYYLNESSTNEGLLRPWLLQRLEAFYLAPKFLTHWIKRPRVKKGYHKIFTLTEEQNLQKIFVSLPRCDSFNAKMCLRIWGNIHTITSKEFEFCEMCTSIVAKTHFVKTGVLRNFPWKFWHVPKKYHWPLTFTSRQMYKMEISIIIWIHENWFSHFLHWIPIGTYYEFMQKCVISSLND